MPRLIHLALALCLAAPAWGQEPIPILFSGKRGLVRSGLSGAWNLGTVNLLKWSEDFSNAAWLEYSITSHTAASVTYTNQGDGALYQAIAVPAGTYTLSCYASSSTGKKFRLAMFDGSTAYNSSNFTPTAEATRFSYTFTSLATSSNVQIVNETPGVAGTLSVSRCQLNEGSTALPYVATTDGQSFSNAVSGGSALVKGTTAGADTNDPTSRLVGLSFAVDDKVAGLPAKGATWTTINCSEAHCYGVDSAGGSFVDGVATAGAVEFDVGTAGGYTGIASYILRYNRVLSAKEHRTNYATFLKLAVNARGGTLP